MIQEKKKIVSKETREFRLLRIIKLIMPLLWKQYRYADEAALNAHVSSPFGQELGKAFKDEDLVAEPMKIILTKSVAGYASKL